MSHILALLVCFPQLSPGSGTPGAYQREPHEILVKHYAPGVFERVAQRRIQAGYHLPITQGWATWTDCGAIGRTLRLSVNGKTLTLTVADCSQPEDRARHERERLVEVSYPAALKLGIVADGKAPGILLRGPWDQ